MIEKGLLVHISEIESSETLEELKEALVRYIQDGENSSTEERLSNIKNRLDTASIDI
jgi:hypothetical protein